MTQFSAKASNFETTSSLTRRSVLSAAAPLVVFRSALGVRWKPCCSINRGLCHARKPPALTALDQLSLLHRGDCRPGRRIAYFGKMNMRHGRMSPSLRSSKSLDVRSAGPRSSLAICHFITKHMIRFRLHGIQLGGTAPDAQGVGGSPSACWSKNGRLSVVHPADRLAVDDGGRQRRRRETKKKNPKRISYCADDRRANNSRPLDWN